LSGALAGIGVTLEMHGGESELAAAKRDPAQHGDARAHAPLAEPPVEPAAAALHANHFGRDELCARQQRAAVIPDLVLATAVLALLLGVAQPELEKLDAERGRAAEPAGELAGRVHLTRARHADVELRQQEHARA